MDRHWLEIRATEEGLIDLPDLVGITPFPGMGSRGFLSLVTNAPSRNPRTRRLPTLYLGLQPLYADRRPEVLVARAQKMLEVARESSRRSIYLMRACQLDGRPGVYAADLFTRSNYVRKLEKRGLEFDGENFVELTSRGTFRSEQLGEFRPSFTVSGSAPVGPDTVEVKSTARTAMTMAAYRLGPMPPEELRRLISALEKAETVTAGPPAWVIDHLRRVLK